MSTKRENQERIEALLSDRALEGLSEQDRAELASLLEGADDASFDHAAAALDLATASTKDPLPAHLAAKIEADAVRGLSKPQDGPPIGSTKGQDRPAARRGEPFRLAGWIAAAACFALAIAGWLRSPPAPEAMAPPAPVSAPEPTAPPSLPPPRVTALASREQIVGAPDAVRADWSATKDPAASAATGDVVWSSSQQKGFMRFHGLAANDPTKSQYQLWIFDPSQDEKTPVDGGVFDVDPSSGDVIVPITAKLRVTKPTLFAVTIEKPGGVVVSSRKRIVVTAAIKS